MSISLRIGCKINLLKDSKFGVFIALLLVLIGGCFLRFESARDTQVDHPLSHDAGEYYQYAYNLRHHHVYSNDISFGERNGADVHPDAVRTPGYPMFLSLFVDGPPSRRILSHIVWAQGIFSALTILFAFLLFRRFLTPLWAIAGGLFVAICPQLIVFNSYILTESVFCFLIVVLAWLVSMFVNKQNFRFALALGILSGLSALVRPSMNLIVLVFFVWLMFMAGGRKGLKLFAGVFIGFMLIMSPWIVRNIVTLKRVSDGTLMINFIHHGMYPDFMMEGRPETFGFPYRDDPRSDEIGRNLASAVNELKNRFSQDPLKYLKWYIFKKPVVFWSWGMIQGYDIFVYIVSDSPYFRDPVFRWPYFFMKSTHNALAVLCLFGCLMAWLPKQVIKLPEAAVHTARFLSAMLIYFTLLHMAGAPFPRYSVPLRPFMYGMAAFVPVAMGLIKRYSPAEPSAEKRVAPDEEDC